MPPVSHIDTKRQLLARAYASCKSTHVAFIDESYVIPKHADAVSFYYAAAYVAPMSAHADIRAELVDIVGGTYWHSTEAHQDEDRRPVIHELCAYVGAGDDSEYVVLAVRSPIDVDDKDGEVARALCLNALLSDLYSRGVALSVVEERRHTKQRNRDEIIVKDLRRANGIGRMQVHFTTPSIEPLLWVPDVVAFAQSHETRGNDFGYIKGCAHKLFMLEVHAPEKQQPPAAEA